MNDIESARKAVAIEILGRVSALILADEAEVEDIGKALEVCRDMARMDDEEMIEAICNFSSVIDLKTAGALTHHLQSAASAKH